eukprot:TRINITY_DN11379_c0_g1_i3.p1 TRINITY_DN11379_c0_g1~~TRINITY_DN11379_c0_g1_i3.p1  ORF type:complete len:320 (+),score=62.47 TRINITY_DN11379_c0_g1_i3:49-1008(+)
MLRPARHTSFPEAVINGTTYLLSFAGPAIVVLFLILRLPLLACVLFPCYLAFTLRFSATDGQGAPWEWFRTQSWVVKRVRSFFPVSLHLHSSLTKPRDQPLQALFALHPHGVTAEFRLAVDGLMYEQLPAERIAPWRTLAAGVLFALPGVRECCLWSSCIDASRASAMKAINRGHSIVVIPGGEAEQLDTEAGVEQVKLNGRFGFVKLAMVHGLALVPGYVFGSVDTHSVSHVGMGARRWLQQKLRVCVPLMWGPYYMPCARKVPQDVVFGEPIILEAIKEPSQEQVQAVHRQYQAALMRLFEERKAEFGCADRVLKVY